MEGLEKYFRKERIHVYQQQFPANYGYNANPYYPQAQRLNYFEQQQRASFGGLKGRPVASVEEARASMIDFDGSVFYFPDLANHKIYTKQINLDGTSSLYVYEQIDNSQAMNQNNPSYVSQEEFQNTINIVLGEIDKLKGAEQQNDEQ